MVVRNGRKWIDASERAAESQKFAPSWGGRMVRKWTRLWIEKQELPQSLRGCHAKVFSLLEDPDVHAELRSWLRTNKWSMNPGKLAEYTQTKIITPEIQKYLDGAVKEEMPRGLIQYIDTVIFPRIQIKGFFYEAWRKDGYIDGHERPDVKEFWSNVFLPKMLEHSRRLVQYVVGDTKKELIKKPTNFVERRLVLCAHDEMTAQANDGLKKEWVFEGQHRLKKKGVGRGLHCSDVICSTVGWMKEAGQELEYGKNYDGYWTGELFVKQVRAFI
ncbi:hypothetical protein K435DRAFT_705817 [Dendrothele bispora CBS 962.96]|uniref:Uncharacterized protein n=1 Tax=Dendrothele bispora (strain CBS 962.96) TaxID=1314807 RepID=A0A4V4HAL7_DENBC|nr:hypothetical protein K435DRAFT_705817 [Dendrothele bispora CBS 962.96]